MPRYASATKKDFDYAAAEREANRTAVKFRSSGDVLGEMSSAYGHSLAGVQIHTDPQAWQLAESHDAEAFTSARDIYMGAGYVPGTASGNELLAHEATHVLQQDPTAGAAMEAPAPMGAVQRKSTDDDDEDPFHSPDAHTFFNPLYEGSSGEPQPFYGEEDSGSASAGGEESAPVGEESAVAEATPQAAEGVAEAAEKVLEVSSPVGAVNTVERVGGLPTVMGLRKMAGLSATSDKKLMKHKTFRAAISAIDEYHKLADTVVSFPGHTTSTPELLRAGDAIEGALRHVIDTSTNAVLTYKNARALWRSSTCTALTPALASIAAKAISLLPRAAGFERSWRTYKAEADVSSATIGAILDSRASAFLSDKSVSTRGGEEQGRDAGLGILHTPLKATESGFRDRSGQILGKIIPDFTKAEPADIVRELRILSSDLRDAAALAATSDRGTEEFTFNKQKYERTTHSAGVSGNRDANKHDAQVPYIALAKLLESVMGSDAALAAFISGATSTEEGFAEASRMGNSLRSLRGVSLQEAAERMRNAEYERNGTIQLESTETAGDAASEVHLEKAKGFIVRTSKNDKDGFEYGMPGITPEQEKNSMNAYADEAMAKLSRLFRSTVIADARVTKYRTKEGAEHYGSYMDLAKGKSAQSYFATMGRGDGSDPFAAMPQSAGLRQHMKNKLEAKDPKQRQEQLDIMNEKLVSEVMTMQVIDFIAASQDRHGGNFFINPEAMNSDDPTAQVVTGIDNDLAFNTKGAAAENEGEGMGTRMQAMVDGRAFRAAKQVELQRGFSMVTQGAKDMVNSISPGQVESTLRPYLGREDLARAVTRYKHLRAHFDTLTGDKIINLATQEGRDAFRKNVRETIYSSVLDTLKFGELEKTGTDDIKAAGINSRFYSGTGGYLGNWLFNSLYESNAKGAHMWENEGYNMAGLYQMMASLGMTQEEAKAMMTAYNQNLSGDAKASETGLNKHFQNKHFLENLPSAG